MVQDFYATVFKDSLIFMSDHMFIYLLPFIPALAVIIGKVIFRAYEKKRLARSGINDIDRMDGKTFEKYMEVLFEKQGYHVERTQYTGDYGADLITRKDGIKTVIQVKRYKRNVGIKAVQEAVAAKGYYKCQESMVACNRFYTKQAKRLAYANGVKLWDRNDLIETLLSMKGISGIDNNPTITNKEEKKPGNYCEVCGIAVSERVAAYCIDNSGRFGGKIFCYEHQKKVKTKP